MATLSMRFGSHATQSCRKTTIVRADKTIELNPANSVLHHQVGDVFRSNDEDFLRLSGAFRAEIERECSWNGSGKEPAEASMGNPR